MKLHEFLVLSSERQSLIDFLVEVNVINNNIKCADCGNIINLDINNFEFKCTKAYYVTDIHRKRKRVRCNFRQSARKNTWFDKSKLSIEKICMFVAYFITLRPPRHDFLKSQLEITDRTIVDWHSFCREVIIPKYLIDIHWISTYPYNVHIHYGYLIDI